MSGVVSVPRVLVTAPQSGGGKTTVTCALMAALKRRGLAVQGAKCGPDYLDPTFHERVVGAPSRNLDLFLGDAPLARRLLARGAAADVTIIEGAMGLFDGIAGTEVASAHDVAVQTQTPCILVVDARGRALTLAAEVLGLASFRKPTQVAAVVLNHATPRSAERLRPLIERECGLAVVGYLPEVEDATLPRRHLGLVDAREIADLRHRIEALASVAAQTIDLEAVLRLAKSAPALTVEEERVLEPTAQRNRVAVAQDSAFSFCYADAREVLERSGAELVPFSPTADEALPEHACGLLLPGGYPELHAERLAENVAMRESVERAVRAGMPTIAECGGFLYLQRTLSDESGTSWPMVGALPGHAARAQGLHHFGYVTLEARQAGLLGAAGTKLAAHEFHRWRSDAEGEGFHAVKPKSDCSWEVGYHTPSLYAGFPHLYLPGCPEVARRFVEACRSWEVGR